MSCMVTINGIVYSIGVPIGASEEEIWRKIGSEIHDINSLHKEKE